MQSGKSIKVILITLLLGLAGCSSAPSTRTVELNADNRLSYTHDVEKKLNEWDAKASKVKADRVPDMKAAINDTRAELESMRAASNDNWETYRSRIDDRLNYIQSVYDRHTAE